MHIVKVFSEELQDTHSLVFLYHYVSTSCKQTNFSKLILFNTSHDSSILKFTDVHSNFIWCAYFFLMIMDLSSPFPCNNIPLCSYSISFTIIVFLASKCIFHKYEIIHVLNSLNNQCTVLPNQLQDTPWVAFLCH